MAGTISIDWARHEDLAGLMITAAQAAAHHGRPGLSLEQRTELEHLVSLGCVFCARRDDDIAGFIAVVDYRLRRELEPGCVHVLHFVIHPAFTNSSVAHALHERLRSEYRRLRLRRLTADGDPDDEQWLQLLSHCGYQLVTAPRWPLCQRRRLFFEFCDTGGTNLTVAWHERALPGASRAERWSCATGHALSLVVDDDLRSGAAFQFLQEEHELDVAAVVAAAMTEYHPLHCDGTNRREATAVLRSTLELATKLSAPWVVCSCGQEAACADQPYNRAVDFFAAILDDCRSLHRQLLLEPEPTSAAFSTASEVRTLLDDLAHPELVGLLVDSNVTATWCRPATALHCRDLHEDYPLGDSLRHVGNTADLFIIDSMEGLDETAFERLLPTVQAQLPSTSPNARNLR